jgi:hypothetical protein
VEKLTFGRRTFDTSNGDLSAGRDFGAFYAQLLGDGRVIVEPGVVWFVHPGTAENRAVLSPGEKTALVNAAQDQQINISHEPDGRFVVETIVLAELPDGARRGVVGRPVSAPELDMLRRELIGKRLAPPREPRSVRELAELRERLASKSTPESRQTGAINAAAAAGELLIWLSSMIETDRDPGSEERHVKSSELGLVEPFERLIDGLSEASRFILSGHGLALRVLMLCVGKVRVPAIDLPELLGRLVEHAYATGFDWGAEGADDPPVRVIAARSVDAIINDGYDFAEVFMSRSHALALSKCLEETRACGYDDAPWIVMVAPRCLVNGAPSPVGEKAPSWIRDHAPEGVRFL